MTSTPIDFVDAAGRLALALCVGSAIGVERQWNQKMAGLRTNALVALGACGFIVYSAMVGMGDPTRVAAQVVSGIGFLGAGIILREGANVHGLNTAATLWCSAMAGAFAGGGFWGLSAVAAGFVIATNLLLRPLVRRINGRVQTVADGETFYTVEVTCKGIEEAHIRMLLLQGVMQAGLSLRSIDSEDIPETLKVAVTAQAVAGKRNDAALEQIVGRLSLEPNVSGAAWQVSHAIPDN